MGDFLAYERFVWFDRQVRGARYPNAVALAGHFEISIRTARRTIDFMRDMLGAPLEYDATRKGFFYLDSSFDFPQIQATQEELLAILLAQSLLSHSAGGLISRDIRKFGKKLFTATGNAGLTENRIRNLFSATWNGYSPAPAATFRIVSQALLHNNRLAFDYRSPLAEEISSRTVEPHHLQHYMGSWILLAWCPTRQGFRKFVLSRMDNPHLAAGVFTPRPRAQWDCLLNRGFGIFQDRECEPVVLRFTPSRARWVQEQIWHPSQELRTLPDGCLELTLPVADFREIKLKILQFGAEVEVVSPRELREELRQEIGKMHLLYEK